MIEVYQTIWAEIRYVVLAKNKQLYLEIVELMKNEDFVTAYDKIKIVMTQESDGFENYKEAAQEIWNHFKNKERDNSHFFASLNNTNENMRLLWTLNLQYQPVYLLNCRIFFMDTYWNRAWIIKNNKIRLFQWDGAKYYRLKLPEELLENIRKFKANLEKYENENKDLMRKAMFLVKVDGQELFNPKIAFAFSNGLELE
jgi:hypothetical protein